MRHRTELQQLTIEGGVEVVAAKDLSPTWGGARQGAGRPKGEVRTRTISCRIPEELYSFIESRASRAGQSVSRYLAALIEECELGYIEHFDSC